MSDTIWGYQPTIGHATGTDLIGYTVEAIDGSIGKVDKHSDDVAAAYLVVDTGVWIFGQHVLLPAGTVNSVDHDEQKIHVGLTRDQIRSPRVRQGPAHRRRRLPPAGRRVLPDPAMRLT